MIHYKSYAQLSQDIAAKLSLIPTPDLVVGIPKSGMIPAIMMASFFNVECLDLDSFLFTHTARTGPKRQASAAGEKLRVLIVDDSISTGTEMSRVRTRVEHLNSNFELEFCVVYGLPDSDPIDGVQVLSRLPQPRAFQWNYRHHTLAEHALFDMDGVLCVDPTDEENDDGPLYREFIKNAKPLTIPTKKISAIVTSRLEKYREQTEEWLECHEVQYKELIMLDLPTAEERQRAKAHAPFKAEIYASRDELLFVESNWDQARQIALATDRPVICTENDCYLAGRRQAEHAESTGSQHEVSATDLEADLRAQLQTAIERLVKVDPGASDWLKQKSINPRTGASRALSSWYDNQAVTQSLRVRPKQETPPKISRVLMVSYSHEIEKGAGAAASTERLHAALQSKGLEVATFTSSDLMEDERASAGQPIAGTNFPFSSDCHDAQNARLLREKIEEFKPDCLILGAVDRGVLSLIELSSLKLPIVWVVRDNWVHTGGCLFKLPESEVEVSPPTYENYMPDLTCGRYRSGCNDCPIMRDSRDRSKAALGYMVRKLVFEHRSDIVFAPISPWMAEMLRAAPLTRQHQIEPVFNPIDLSIVRPINFDLCELRRKLELPEEKKLVLLSAFSLSNPRKGMQLFLDSIEGDSRFDDVVFVRLGRPGREKTCIDSRCISLGFVTDEEKKIELYNAVDAVLVPALQESLSVVASDAICCGTPVVSFRTGGLQDFLEHKKTGYLAKAFDGSDLLNGLSWVLFKAGKKSLSAGCRAAGERHFSKDRNIDQLLKLMKIAQEKYADLGPPSLELNVFREAYGLLSRERTFSLTKRGALADQVKSAKTLQAQTKKQLDQVDEFELRKKPGRWLAATPENTSDWDVVALFYLFLGRRVNAKSIAAKSGAPWTKNFIDFLGSKEFKEKTRARLEAGEITLKEKSPHRFEELCRYFNARFGLSLDENTTHASLLLEVLTASREALLPLLKENPVKLDETIQWLSSMAPPMN